MGNNFAYADTQEEAQARYSTYRNIDPFPTIEAALLNTADIADYVRETGMICPFNPEKLRSASYEMNLGGEILFWDENDKENNFELLNYILNKRSKIASHISTIVTLFKD